jgi:hypothetical protein
MPSLPRLSSRESLGPAAAEGLLDGRGVPANAPAGQHALARLLEIAGGPGSDSELAGQAVAMAAFTRATAPAGAHRSARRKRRPLASHLTAKLALCAGACVTALGGAAAYASALPAPLQELAHVTFGAPAPRHAAPAPHATSASPGQPASQASPSSQASPIPASPAGHSAHRPGRLQASPNGTPGYEANGHRRSHPKKHKAHPNSAAPSPQVRWRQG